MMTTSSDKPLPPIPVFIPEGWPEPEWIMSEQDGVARRRADMVHWYPHNLARYSQVLFTFEQVQEILRVGTATMKVRKFIPPADDIWGLLCSRVHQLSAELNTLNENQPEKGSPSLAAWEEERKRVRRLIVECHEEKLRVLQSCYKKGETK